MGYPAQVGEGKSYPDGSYDYVCAACRDSGFVDGSECVWCYGKDPDRILDEMRKGARGQRYYALLKAYLSVKGRDIVAAAQWMHGGEHKLTVTDLGRLHLRFGLNFKALTEWLEECGVIRPGTYERLHYSGIRVKDIVAAAQDAESEE